MLEVDLHAHTSFSKCGIHSHIEMLSRAAEMGMKGVAITDHGPTLGGRVISTLFERLHDPVPGVRFLKGMECNILEQTGCIDLPSNLLKYLDIVLLGLHPNTPKGLKPKDYTRMLVAAVENNPCVDVLSHINDPVYPVEFQPLAALARDNGLAIELNNSKTLLGRADNSSTRSLVETCAREGCRVAVTSDAHSVNELGRDESVAPFINAAGFPSELLVTRNAEAAYGFIEERRDTKR